MPRATFLAVAVAVLLACASPLRACPVCDSETGCAVRSGIFNEQFGSRLVLTLLPFPVFLGVVAAIHFGFPFWMSGSAGPDALRPPEIPLEDEVRS